MKNTNIVSPEEAQLKLEKELFNLYYELFAITSDIYKKEQPLNHLLSSIEGFKLFSDTFVLQELIAESKATSAIADLDIDEQMKLITVEEDIMYLFNSMKNSTAAFITRIESHFSEDEEMIYKDFFTERDNHIFEAILQGKKKVDGLKLTRR